MASEKEKIKTKMDCDECEGCEDMDCDMEMGEPFALFAGSLIGSLIGTTMGVIFVQFIINLLM